MSLSDLLQTLGRPPGTAPGGELGIWWRLAYRGGRYITEPWDQGSIRDAARGATALQLVTSPDTPYGAGVMHIELQEHERPIFYRIRSFGMNNGEAMPKLDAIVYGKASEVDTGWNSDTRRRVARGFGGVLWCIKPNEEGLEHRVPRRWIDLAMIDAQYEG